MIQKINEILNLQGFEKIRLNSTAVYLHVKKQNNAAFAFITIDETSGQLLQKEQWENITKQITSFLSNQGFYPIVKQYLLVSTRVDNRSLFDADDCFWIANANTGQFMVFDDANALYGSLHKPFEDYFSTLQNVENTEFHASDEMDFQRRQAKCPRVIQALQRVPYFAPCNFILIFINLIAFLATELTSIGVKESVLLTKGAMYWGYVLKNHEYYRVFTSMFLHYGLDHIFNNMLVLLVIGFYLERMVGKGRYLAIYLGSGILAGISSMVYNMMQNQFTVSVGASGAIFGVMGALLFLVLFQKTRREELNIQQILIMVFLSLYGGFTSQGVDNAAHIGGFIAGFVLAGLLSLVPQRKHQ